MRRLALALLLSFPVLSCEQAAQLEVKNAWTRETPGNAANAAVFMTVRSTTPDRLIAASSPAARKIDLMTMESGRTGMGMRYLKAIDIPADRPVSLNPTGLHVWLAGLNQPLKAGQSMPLSLTFEKAGERRVTVSVIKAAAPPPSGL